MEHPEELNRDTLYELRNLVARYPYFQTARLLYLKNLFLLHDIDFGSELRKSVLYVADRRMLFYLIEGDRYRMQPRPSVPEMQEAEPDMDRTLFLIDSFLATLPEEHTADSGELDYAMDYTAYLMQDEEGTEEQVSEEGPLRQPAGEEERPRSMQLIDGFLRQSEETREFVGFSESEEEADRAESGVGDSPEADWQERLLGGEEELEENCFTETLAKIYIKQHRYEKALEIIKKLSLNYPKKNAYFADQIRFLEKLIINAKSK